MNGVGVLAVSHCQRYAPRVQTQYGVRFIVTGACQYTQPNFSLFPITVK